MAAPHLQQHACVRVGRGGHQRRPLRRAHPPPVGLGRVLHVLVLANFKLTPDAGRGRRRRPRFRRCGRRLGRRRRRQPTAARRRPVPAAGAACQPKRGGQSEREPERGSQSEGGRARALVGGEYRRSELILLLEYCYWVVVKFIVASAGGGGSYKGGCCTPPIRPSLPA